MGSSKATRAGSDLVALEPCPEPRWSSAAWFSGEPDLIALALPRGQVACYRISLPVRSSKATRSGSDLVALEVPRPKKSLQPKTYRRKAQEVLTDEKPKKS